MHAAAIYTVPIEPKSHFSSNLKLLFVASSSFCQRIMSSNDNAWKDSQHGDVHRRSDLEETKKLLLKHLKPEVPSVLLLRHAERYHITKPGEADVELNEAGERESCELGNFMKSTFKDLKLESLVSSPFRRCRKTAQNIGRLFLGEDAVVRDDYVLFGYPFAIRDYKIALKYMWKLGIFTYVKQYLSGEPLDGHEPVEPAMVKFAEFFDGSIPQDGLKVMASHDFYVMVFLVKVFGYEMTLDSWPGFLDGVLFYKDNGKLIASYREKTVDVFDALRSKKSEPRL